MPTYVIEGRKIRSEQPLTEAEIDEIAASFKAEAAPVTASTPIKPAAPSIVEMVMGETQRGQEALGRARQDFAKGAVENLPGIAAIGVPLAVSASTGPLAPVTLAGLSIAGGMAGEASRQQLQGEPLSVQKIGQEGLLGAVGEGIGQLVSRGVPATIRGIKSVLGVGEEAPRSTFPLPERELAQQTVQALGETIPASRVGGELGQLFEGVSRAGVGAGTFAAAEARIGQAMQRELDTITNNVASMPMTDVQTGEALKVALESAEQKVKQAVAPFYNQVIPARGRNVPVDLKALSTEAKQTMSKALSMSQSGKTPLGLEAEDVGLLKQLSDVKANMTFAEAHELRSNLLAQSRKLESKYGPDNDFSRLVKGAIKTVNEQMDAAAEAFDPELKRLYKKTSSEYRDAMSTLYDKTVVKVLNKNPEKVGDALAVSGNVTEALKVRQALALARKNKVPGVDAIEENLMRSYLQQISKGMDGNLNDFVALGDKLRDPKFRRTFTVMMQIKPDVRSNIEKLIRAARVAADQSKPSMLGGGAIAAATASSAMAAGMAAGGVQGAVSGGMGGLAILGTVQAAMAKILTSPSATNTLLAAERALQSGNTAKAVEILQSSQTIQRLIGQTAVRTEPVREGFVGVR
jgi:hypothetical protein